MRFVWQWWTETGASRVRLVERRDGKGHAGSWEIQQAFWETLLRNGPTSSGMEASMAVQGRRGILKGRGERDGFSKA